MVEATLVTFEGRAMGSALRLTLGEDEAGSGARVGVAWAEVVDEFERAEQAMSRFRETSELTELNRSAGTGRDVAVGRRLERAIVAADRARRVTGGRFDPRVLVDLDRLGYRGVALESRTASHGGPAGSTSRARHRHDERVACRTAPGRLRIDEPLDLGGIGKGLALRWASARLDRCGAGSYLLEAGGDLVTRGRGAGEEAWRIGIEDPSGGHGPVAVVVAGDLAVTTSSVAVNAWTHAGRPAHHLIDPSTGRPGGSGLLAVTVAGQDPAWAEVWSKTLFLAGRGGIGEQARARGLAAWWIGDDGGIEMTPAARIRTVWVAAEA